MACKKEWLINYYYAPLKQIANAIEEAQQVQKAQNLLNALSRASQNPEGCNIM